MEQDLHDQNPSQGSSTTVDKAVKVLEALAASRDGSSLGELVGLLETHRAPLYRILRSLELAGFIVRRADRKYELGFGLKRIAQNVPDRITDIFQPWMRFVCESVSMTGMLNVFEAGHLTVRHIQVPTNSGFHVITDVGYTYDLDVLSAPVIAALASMPAHPADAPEVIQCRTDGYASATNRLRAGVSGIAVPVQFHGACGSISFVRAERMEPEDLAALVPLATTAVADAIQGRLPPPFAAGR
jgi:DNA-binding IclR family transcriptional regulator